MSETRSRRTNVREILLDDMTRSKLDDESFDIVVSVEVLEHVEQDELFVDQVHRILKPGGTFLMTTPNGDYLKKPNVGHVRHYTRQQLLNLLSSRFSEVHLEYAIKGGIFRRWGLRSISIGRPDRILLTAVGNFINSLESSPRSLKTLHDGTHHLIAVAKKQV
jgi:SAM-dependent methyltransferase